MNKRQKKKLAKRGNHWHYRQFRIFTKELRFIDNGTDYTKNAIYVRWNRKHTRYKIISMFTNCYPSAVYTDSENTTIITDDYIIHIDLSKYGDIAAEQNIEVNKNGQ
jgi:hypothetical protein